LHRSFGKNSQRIIIWRKVRARFHRGKLFQVNLEEPPYRRIQVVKDRLNNLSGVRTSNTTKDVASER
jgi:flagellar basal body P-ring protein FlgI